jgi:hypothetical protein
MKIKKTISIILICTLLLVPIVFAQTTLNPDIDSNGEVDILDILLVVNDYGKISGFDPRVDLNNDGQINILDIIIITNKWGIVRPYPHLQYFGYFGSNYIGGCSGPSCTGQLADHANVIHVYAELNRLPALAAEFQGAAQNGVGVIVNVASVFFPWPDAIFQQDTYQQDWTTMSNFLKDYESQIVAFYHIDEPYYNIYGQGSLVQQRKAEMETANNAIKSSFPNIPIAVTFGPWIGDNLAIPQGYNWVGFDCYVYSISHSWDDCQGYGNSPQYYVNLLKSKKTQNQRIFLVPDGQFFRDRGIDFTPELEQRKVDIADRYYNLAKNEQDIVMILPYLWHSYEDGGYLYRGTRDMNLLKTRYNQIGREISGK